MLAALTCLGACSPSPEVLGPSVVLVTIFPLADLVAAAAGPALRIETLLPPRASLHTWEATPGQVRAVAHARGFVSIGAGLDDWLDPLGGGRTDLARLRLTEGIPLLDAPGHDDHGPGTPGEEGGDPHVWLDPVLVRDEFLPRLGLFLEALAPQDRDGIRLRTRALADSLTALDREIRDILSKAPGRSFVSAHEAWRYFARRYGLGSLGSVYERPGHEPSARGLARLAEAARGAALPAVLAEPQLAETAARVLATEIGAGVVVVDPLGGGGLEGREGYLALMRFNARGFARAMGAP